MSAAPSDLAHVRRAFEEFEARFEEFRARGVDEFFGRYYDAGAVLENVDSFPMPARYEGVTGYRRWFDESYGPYEDIHWEIDDVRPAGERVLALVRVRGRPVGDPTVIEVGVGCLYELRDGRIAHTRIYLGYERALEAARLATSARPAPG